MVESATCTLRLHKGCQQLILLVSKKLRVVLDRALTRLVQLRQVFSLKLIVLVVAAVVQVVILVNLEACTEWRS